MISIIDYGVSNSQSVSSILQKLGYNSRIIFRPSEIKNESKFILPGIGSYDYGINKLKKAGWFNFIKKKFLDKKYFLLGLCLGMQMLMSSSEEGYEVGLNLIPGKVKKFFFNSNNKKKYKIPLVGWKNVEIVRNNRIFNNINKKDKFYFVHSYFCNPVNKKHILATTNYGFSFPSIIRKNNIFGFQFHPEKSYKQGMQILENFANLE
jgi:glutamine amidotransferase